MWETGGLELAATITFVLQANRLTKCASQPEFNRMVNSTELDASQGRLDDNIELLSSSNDNAFEMDENNYVDRFFGDSSDEDENDNAENQEIRHA